MTLLDSWTRGEHTAPVNGTATTHPTYRKGTGPGVVVIHEIPGITPDGGRASPRRWSPPASRS